MEYIPEYMFLHYHRNILAREFLLKERTSEILRKINFLIRLNIRNLCY